MGVSQCGCVSVWACLCVGVSPCGRVGVSPCVCTYLYRALHFKCLIVFTSENEEGLPNLRPHLLNFLRDKVLHGRQPNQENKKEIVDFLVNNFQPQLANCWVSVSVNN